MKTKDLLKYFMDGTKAKVFVIDSEENCGISIFRQVLDEFDCELSNFYENYSIKPGKYLVTYPPKGLKCDFIIVKEEVIRYFTLIEEE